MPTDDTDRKSSNSRLSRGQWTQFGILASIPTIVMAFSLFTWVEGRVYTRTEGNYLEKEVERIDKQHQKFEDKVYQKLDKIYELLIERKRRD